MEAKGMFAIAADSEDGTWAWAMHYDSVLQRFRDESCSDDNDLVEALPSWPKASAHATIMVWEGRVDKLGEDDAALVGGSWREPTGDEWMALREKRNPWRPIGGEPMPAKTWQERMPQPQTERAAGIEIEVMQPTKIIASAIRLRVPFDDEDDIPEGFPGSDHFRMKLTLTLDLISKRVREWKADTAQGVTDLCLKVRDAGTYELLGPYGEVVAARVEEYVPRSIPTGGDYVEFTLLSDGTIKGWAPKGSDIAIDFFGREDD